MMSSVVAFLIGLLSSAPAVAQASPQLSTNQIRVLYARPTDARHQPTYEALQERRVLETLRSMLNPLRLPRELTLELKSCGGKVDAYYWEATATVCYEYVELIQQHAPKVGTPGGLTRADAIVVPSSTRSCTKPGMRSSICSKFRCSGARKMPPTSSRPMCC